MTFRHRAITAAFAAACSVLLTAPAALAAPPNAGKHGEHLPLNLPEQAPKNISGQSASGGLARTLVGLAVVLGVIYLIAWVLRTVKKSKEERATGRGLQSEAVVPLGPGRSLHLIRAGRDLVLLGVAEHGVTPIRTYSEDEAREIGLIDDDYDFDPATGGNGSSSGGSGGGGGGGGLMMRALDHLRRRTVR